MKNKYIKPFLFLMCVLALVGTVGAGVVYAVGADKQEGESEKEISLVTDEPEPDLGKNETVYVLADADGSVQKIIVSDWIKNTVGCASISDKSELTNVEAVKGDETYILNSDNMRVWDAQGNDIYYQGDIKKELPVNLSVSYTLDGKGISPSELSGKSGKVTIRFNYANNQYKMVEIDGRKEKIYVPFTMLTGMLLDTDKFANVEVSNGKLINDGNHIAVVGVAFPGLQSNLNVDTDKLEIPDYVEITADVKDFELTNTVTIATNEIFSELNTKELNSVDDLSSSLDELTDAMKQLMDGSSQLYDGLCMLLEKSGELVSGINQLADGTLQLKNGSIALNNGATELADGAEALANGTSSLADGTAQLVDGAKALAGGLDTLAANNDTLNNGAKQIFESLLSMADSQLAAAGLTVEKLTIENYAQVLNGVIASLDQNRVGAQAEEAAYQTVAASVNEQRAVIQAAVTAEVRGGVTEQVLASMGISANTIDAATQEQINALVDERMQSENIQNMISVKTEEQIALLINQNMNSPEVQAQMTAALEAAASGAASISALKEQLDSYYQFYIGLNQYTAGVASAKDGARQLYTGAGQVNKGAVKVDNGSNQLKDGAYKLKAGTAELNSGMSELYAGILTLKNGTPALTDGVTKLRDGAMQLSDGMKEFNENGVQKLVDAVDNDISGLIARIKATIDVSKDYKSFSGLSDNMDGQVKFIYRTEAIDAK